MWQIGCIVSILVALFSLVVLGHIWYKQWKMKMSRRDGMPGEDDAELRGIKVVYLRPDAWPMRVEHPDGDQSLTVPVEPTEMRESEFTWVQMSPHTPGAADYVESTRKPSVTFQSRYTSPARASGIVRHRPPTRHPLRLVDQLPLEHPLSLPLVCWAGSGGVSPRLGRSLQSEPTQHRAMRRRILLLMPPEYLDKPS